MTVYPCAKINLGLNIVSRRPDGYHNLETVFYPVGIHDELTIAKDEKTSSKYSCTLELDGLKVDGDPRNNLVVKAYHLLSGTYRLPSVKVKLNKQIPLQAGMGGGSADCAYMILALNEMFNLGLSVPEMKVYASKLGADCAFFINPVPSFAEGIGDQLSAVDVDLGKYNIVIVKPNVAISTKEAFARIKPKAPVTCCRDIVMHPVESWRLCLFNDFEDSVIPIYPKIGKIKERLYSLGAVYAAMSGSGSALFGLFNDAPTEVKSLFPDCFTAVIPGCFLK